jgi:hypothetical protein
LRCHRNGASGKTLLTRTPPAREVPRDRDGSFEPLLILKPIVVKWPLLNPSAASRGKGEEAVGPAMDAEDTFFVECAHGEGAELTDMG